MVILWIVVISKKDGEIDWRLSAEEIWRRVRAFYPWPGCYTKWGGRVLRIHQAVPLRTKGSSRPGLVVAIESGRPAVVGVETGDGTLGLVAVQLEGKRSMPAVEFLRGQRDFIGDNLGD